MVTTSKKCKHCTREFRTNNKNLDKPEFEYCSVCRKHHKNCEVCGKEFRDSDKRNRRFCSKECYYEIYNVDSRKRDKSGRFTSGSNGNRGVKKEDNVKPSSTIHIIHGV